VAGRQAVREFQVSSMGVSTHYLRVFQLITQRVSTLRENPPDARPPPPLLSSHKDK